MYEVSLTGNTNQLPLNTYLVYGDSGSGKTRFAATFPRPLFLSDATEQGWETIKYMPDEDFFEANVKPIVWGIEQMNDMAQAIERAKPLIASRKVMTVVVDSLSFYSDLYLNYLFALQGAKPDNRQAYGQLGQHLRDLRVKIHGLGVNVVWLALAKHPEQDDLRGRPLIPGQQSDKFCAGTNFVFFTRIDNGKREGGKVVNRTFEIRTMEYGPYLARNRLGNHTSQLPDPFVGTYAQMLEARGYDLDTLYKGLSAPVAQAKPTPVVAKPVITSAPKVVTVPPMGNGAHKGATIK